MGKFSKDIIDRITEASNIIDVVGENVSLRKKGVNQWGVCPFHKDSDPSMCVSESKQLASCFVCDETWNVFSFVMKYDNISFPEAVRYLGKKYSIEIPEEEQTTEEDVQLKKKDSVRIALNASTTHFKSNLNKNIAAQSYLKERGYTVGTNQTLDTYNIGYAEDSYTHLQKHLQSKAFSIDIMLEAGVIKKNDNDSLYDFFRNRIMFPYYDQKGNVIGFTGRIITPNKKAAKYQNTGDTIVFKKGIALFGLYQASKAIGRMDKVYYVEGQFDVLALANAGITNTVAGSGTAMTDEQIKLLLRFTKNVTLIYDCDDAGIKATIKNIHALLAHGAKVRAIKLPEGQDPDQFTKGKSSEELLKFLIENETDWASYLIDQYHPLFTDPLLKEESLVSIVECIALIKEKSLRASYSKKIADVFEIEIDIAKQKIRDFTAKLPKSEDEMKPGFYGFDALPDTLKEKHDTCILTNKFKEFSELYGSKPIIYFKGIPSTNQIQELRRHVTYIQYNTLSDLEFNERTECDELVLLSELYKLGFVVYVSIDGVEMIYIDYYIANYSASLDKIKGDIKAVYCGRCADLISHAPDDTRIIGSKEWPKKLLLDKKQYNDILKPYLDKKKSKAVISIQSANDELMGDNDDPALVPDYVKENEEYNNLYLRHGFYPRLNMDKEPVCYMFRNTNNNGHIPVADFYMIPLLHIYDTDSEFNKRVIRINRRGNKQPIYMEIKSKALATMQSFEEILLNEEALNFENGDIKHFKKIRQAMSYNYIKCEELKTYGQQQENFFAFANAIFHEVDNVFKIDYSDKLGVATHNNENYYLPAFSEVYSRVRKDNDTHEKLRSFVYKEIPIEQQCSFEKWAKLMDEVYKINDNGKWALIYSIMCAFRSDIHSIDRLFTAVFFMGPTMSGKTQIGISARSLYITPELSAFNLTTGTDAAFHTLMGSYRDVPQLLDEYNNKMISDDKFQGLKSITYDGDGKQKRKGISSKELETSKVYSPVIIMGQETPQRDDNALMNRVIICEVPKKKEVWDPSEKEAFDTLKAYEKNGLSNVLLEVLKLRKIVRKHYKKTQREVESSLTKSSLVGENKSGDMVRIIKTVSLFLTMHKIIDEHATHLKLPFSYEEFYAIAAKKVMSQVEMISHSDKLSGFFKSMDVMINTKTLLYGREFIIDQPGSLTLNMPGGEKKSHILKSLQTKVLYIRLSLIYTLFSRSSFNSEDTSQSTIEANIRSNPSYIGLIANKRFKWREVGEVTRAETGSNCSIGMSDMVRIMKTKHSVTSCIALDYDIFKKYFDIDIEREDDSESEPQKYIEQPLNDVSTAIPQIKQTTDLPF